MKTKFVLLLAGLLISVGASVLDAAPIDTWRTL